MEKEEQKITLELDLQIIKLLERIAKIEDKSVNDLINDIVAETLSDPQKTKELMDFIKAKQKEKSL